MTIRRTIQYEGGRYAVRDRPKDDEARTIAMPQFLVDVLREHRKEQMAERERDYAEFVPHAARTPAQRQKASLRLRRHEARRERRKANDDAWAGLVFTARDGGPVYESGVGRRLKAIIDRINQERLGEARRVASGVGDAPEVLPHVTFYQLRHTGATWMLASGVPEHELQAIMGHSSPAMTRRYAAVLQPQRLAAADRLDAALRDAGGVRPEEDDEATPSKEVAPQV